MRKTCMFDYKVLNIHEFHGLKISIKKEMGEEFCIIKRTPVL